MSWAIEEKSYSQRRACSLLSIAPKVFRYAYRAVAATLRFARGSARWRPSGGGSDIGVCIFCCGEKAIMLNHKKLFRLYREERLVVRQAWRSQAGFGNTGADDDRHRVRTSAGAWTSSPTYWPTAAASGCLTVVDDFTRECLALVVDTSLSGRRVARELNHIVERRGAPLHGGQRQRHRADLAGGPELGRRIAASDWHYIAPGKPSAERFIESLNGRLRDECLNEHVFQGLPEARRIIEEWRADYNAHRPHTSLRGLTPNEFATRSRTDHNQNGFWL